MDLRSAPPTALEPQAASRRYRLEEVDGLRAVACLMVLCYHTSQFASLPRLGPLVEPLACGVDVFIVLSGFCLFLPVAAAPNRFTARRFWRQRIRRIVPAYYASILYVVLLPELLVIFWRAFGKPASWQPVPDLMQWLTHLTFTHMFSTTTWAGINGSYWSLGLEAQFYLAMPFVVLMFRRFGVRGLMVPIGISVLWNVCVTLVVGDGSFHPSSFLWTASLFGRWMEFTLGAAAAYVVHRARTGQITLRARSCWTLTAGGVALTVLSMYWLNGLFIFKLVPAPLPFGVAALLIGISGRPDDRTILPGRLLRTRPFRALGLISYSFYLIHQPTEWYLAQLLKTLGIDHWLLWAAELTVGAAIVTALAALSYLVFERPFLGSTRRVAPTRAG